MYLIALGFDDEDATRVIAPLTAVHDLRSKVKAHAPGKDAVAVQKANPRGSRKLIRTISARFARSVTTRCGRLRKHSRKWDKRRSGES
jgi:hypothetical protein